MSIVERRTVGNFPIQRLKDELNPSATAAVQRLVRIVAVVAVLLSLAVPGAVGLGSPRPTPPREIIANIYNTSQRDRLAAIKTIIVTGSTTLGKQHGTVTAYWKAPNKFVIVTKYTDESESYAAGFNGRKGWFAYPSGVIEGIRPEDEASNDCSGIWLSNSDWFPERWPTTVRYAGWTMVQGAPAIVVDVTFKVCGTFRHAYDLKTLREIFDNQHPDGRIFLDRDAPVVHGPDGMSIQAFQENTLRHSSIHGSIWYDSLRVNVPLDDEMFEYPRCWGQCEHAINRRQDSLSRGWESSYVCRTCSIETLV